MKTLIGDVMAESYRRGWITLRDGNCSIHRKGSDYFWMSPSAIRKNVIRHEDLLKMSLTDELDEFGMRNATHLEPSRNKPSIELGLHRMLGQRSKHNRTCVLHLHPTYTIAAMASGWKLPDITKEFPELTRYTKVGPNCPYYDPGAHDLSVETVRRFGIFDDPYVAQYDIVGMEKHGVTAIAADPWAAFEHVERLEHVCQILLLSRYNNTQ